MAAMRQCTKCGEERPLDFFNRRGSCREGRRHDCKSCYSKHVKGLRRRNLAYKWSHFEDHPCIDCGQTNPMLLEFDHISDKKFNITSLMRGSIDRLKTEMAKCVVRCVACHRLVTIERLAGPSWEYYQEWLSKQKAA